MADNFNCAIRDGNTVETIEAIRAALFRAIREIAHCDRELERMTTPKCGPTHNDIYDVSDMD